MSNHSDAQKALVGILTNDRGGEATVNDLLDVLVVCEKPAADAAAADATNRNFWRNLTAATFRVEAVQVLPDAALTANDTNNATVNLLKGASATVTTNAASKQTTVANANWVADTPVSLTLSATAANRLIAPNEILCLDIAKTGTGVVVPALGFIVQLRRV